MRARTTFLLLQSDTHSSLRWQSLVLQDLAQGPREPRDEAAGLRVVIRTRARIRGHEDLAGDAPQRRAEAEAIAAAMAALEHEVRPGSALGGEAVLSGRQTADGRLVPGPGG